MFYILVTLKWLKLSKKWIKPMKIWFFLCIKPKLARYEKSQIIKTNFHENKC